MILRELRFLPKDSATEKKVRWHIMRARRTLANRVAEGIGDEKTALEFRALVGPDPKRKNFVYISLVAHHQKIDSEGRVIPDPTEMTANEEVPTETHSGLAAVVDGSFEPAPEPSPDAGVSAE